MSDKRRKVKEMLSARIIDSALSEFARKGYVDTTIQSIAEKAGVSVGVICKYFESKEGLLRTLMDRDNLALVFKDLESEEPEDVFNHFIDYIKDTLLNRTEVFDFYRSVFGETELNKSPNGFCTRYLSEEFRGSIMERAILRAQEEGELPKAEPVELYLLLVHSVFGALDYYRVIGLPVPENSFILSAIHFTPGEKNRRKFIEEKETEIRGLSKDLRLMASTINRLFPLSIYINLSKNKYHMLDYDNYYARTAEYSGTYDELIAAGMSTIDDEADRENFKRTFDRQALLESFTKGKDAVGLLHTQTGDDGVVRLMYTRALMSKDESGDILAISVAYEMPEYLIENTGYKQLIEEFNRKTGRG